MTAAGELSGLAAAALWAVSVSVFKAPIADHGARAINLAKCLLATALLAITTLFMGAWASFAITPVPHLLFLATSGIVGLTIGDTALFVAVTRIGVHRALLLQTTAPLFATLIALSTGERLSFGQMGAGAVVLAGVALVVMQPMRGSNGRAAVAAAGGAGLVFGLLASFSQGAGVVLAKQGLGVLPVLPATFLRLAVASVGLVAVSLVHDRLRSFTAVLRSSATLRRVVPASFLGTYAALLLMMAGVALAPASVAAVLLATAPVFSLVIEALINRRPPTLTAVIGTILAVAGVALLTAQG